MESFFNKVIKNMYANKVIFLDRDGVINKEIGYLHKINDFEFIKGVFDSCKFLIKKGYKLIIVTNQSGIGRGYYTQSDFDKLTRWMLKKFSDNGVEILDVLFCPHTPEFKCDCRKPKPGMLIYAKNKYNLDMNRSWLIGDKEVDIDAAISSGINNHILVRTGHKIDEKNSKALFILDSIAEVKSVI